MDIKMLTCICFATAQTSLKFNLLPESGHALQQVQHVIATGKAGETGPWWLMRGDAFRLWGSDQTEG